MIDDYKCEHGEHIGNACAVCEWNAAHPLSTTVNAAKRSGRSTPPPGSAWYPLFEHMSKEHGLTLLDDELNSIAMKADEARLKSCALLAVSGTELEVCRNIADRQAAGIQKYGMTVASNPAHLREWLQHACEESLDKAIYLKRAMAELDAANNPPA